MLPRADYEALLDALADAEEDAADVAIYDARKAAASPLLPAEVSMAILRGDSRLRALRKWRDVTQLELADRTGISQGFLSDLENGKRTLTGEVRLRIAAVLQISEQWLA